MKPTIPRRRDIRSIFENEYGQTMAEYSVVLTLIIIVFGIGAFTVLALAIGDEFERITGFLT